MEPMNAEEKPTRGRIPLHRSVRHVRFSGRSLAIWILLAVAITAIQWHFLNELLAGYGSILEHLLSAARVPFGPGTGDRLASIPIPAWRVATYNPAAVLPGALAYLGAGLALILSLWFAPRLPYPLRAWLALLGLLLCLVTLVLAWRPEPRFTPDLFSALWMKLTVATSLAFPWIWSLLVGILPLPFRRAVLWGGFAWLVLAAWNVIRLAFFLALARAAGVLWLPVALVFGSTMLDGYVLVIAFARVLEPAGHEWEYPA